VLCATLLPPARLVDNDKVERGKLICEHLEEAARADFLEIAISSEEVQICVHRPEIYVVHVILYDMSRVLLFLHTVDFATCYQCHVYRVQW